MKYVFSVTPMGKPRMTRGDRWKKRPAVLRYWEFADEMRRQAEAMRFVPKPAGMTLVFHIPMPASWSEKKKRAMEGRPHTAKPDKDNIEKGCWDSLLGDDACIWHTRDVVKLWAREGSIEIHTTEGDDVEAAVLADLARLRDGDSPV